MEPFPGFLASVVSAFAFVVAFFAVAFFSVAFSVVFFVVEGSCRIIDNEKNEVSVQAGETILLPAATQEVTIVPEGAVKLLETYV